MATCQTLDQESRRTLCGEKKRRDWLKALACQHPDWLLFDHDECWFSRFAQPNAHAWGIEGEALRLVQRDPPRKEQQKAVACFGAVRQDTDQVYLYFSDGQPNSEHTLVFLQGLLDIARHENKRVAVVIWDHASWHKSKRVKRWVRDHNRQAKREGDVRLLRQQRGYPTPLVTTMLALDTNCSFANFA